MLERKLPSLSYSSMIFLNASVDLGSSQGRVSTFFADNVINLRCIRPEMNSIEEVKNVDNIGTFKKIRPPVGRLSHCHQIFVSLEGKLFHLNRYDETGEKWMQRCYFTG